VTTVRLGGLRARLAALALLVVVVPVLVGSPAGAQTSGGGELGPGYVRATAADLGAGRFGGTGLPARAPATRSPLTWARATTGQVCVVFATPPAPEVGVTPLPGPSVGWPLTPGQALGAPSGTVLVHELESLPADVRVVGRFVVEVGDDRSRTGDVIVVPRCTQPGDPALAGPPSAAEIWERTPLPRVAVHASPPGTHAWPGITRLGTDFWSDPLAITTAAVAIDGYAVAVTAVPLAYAWSFGDGTELVTPAGERTRLAYLRRGEFIVTRYVVWEGRARVSAFGLDFGELDLGTVTIPEEVPYRVAEVRSLLRTPSGRR
jgi:hypothetical protein